MPIDVDATGRKSAPYTASWTSKDSLIYSLGVGAGVDEPAFTTETTEGVDQRVLPTFALVIGASLDTMPDFGTYDLANLVHGEQRVTVHEAIPCAGTVEIHREIVGVWDKGKAAVVATETVAIDQATERPLFTTWSSSFIAGEGGWGGDRGPSASGNVAPERPADARVVYETSRDQALIYRLSGDTNRLHTDPAFAARGGFPQPILHGLCTYGFAGRALLHALCGSDPARFLHMEGRFSAPVLPGDTLTVDIWRTAPGEAVFQTARTDGTVVIDRGGVRFVEPSAPHPGWQAVV